MFSYSAYKKYSTSPFRSHKADKEIALLSQAILVKGFGKSKLLCLTQLLLATASYPCSLTDAFSSGASLLLLPGTGRNALSDLHCLATHGAAAGASCTAAELGSHLSNFLPCHQGSSVALAAKGWGWAVHKPGNRTHSMMWYKPSNPLVHQNIQHMSYPTLNPSVIRLDISCSRMTLKLPDKNSS